MVDLINNKFTYVWCFLALLTGVSWLVGDGFEPTTIEGRQYATVALLALAFFKTRLVVMYFMEILHAPIPVRVVFEVWVVGVCAAIVGIYLTDGALFLSLFL